MAAAEEELQSPQQQQQQEVCCWRFEPVIVLGREGVIVLTGRRLLFAAPKGSSRSNEAEADSSNISSWEVLLQFPLAAWTSTERSKKAAKVRSYLLCAGLSRHTAEAGASVAVPAGSVAAAAVVAIAATDAAALQTPPALFAVQAAMSTTVCDFVL